MKITAIFEKVQGRLFAAKFGEEQEDELEKAIGYWKNPIYLREFFNQYRADLARFDSSLKLKAVLQFVRNEADEMHDILIEMALRDKLEELFKPLDNREELLRPYQFQKVKAKGPERKSMVRLYAVRADDQYVVSGSAIKLTYKMERPHLRAELHKLDLLRQYLQRDGINGMLE